MLAEAIERNELYVKPYRWSFMFTPPTHHNRYLMTVWRNADTPLRLTYSAHAFSEFFPVTAADAAATLGEEEVPHPIATDDDARSWGAKLDQLFKIIKLRQEGN
jgi:hypothetical protein